MSKWWGPGSFPCTWRWWSPGWHTVWRPGRSWRPLGGTVPSASQNVSRCKVRQAVCPSCVCTAPAPSSGWVSPWFPWPAPPGCTGSGGESVLCSNPHSNPEVKVHPQTGWGSLGCCLAHFPLKASEAWGQILQSWLTRWPLPANQGPVQVRQLEPLKVRPCEGVPTG